MTAENSSQKINRREFSELARLEKKYDIGQILRSDPAVAPVDGTMTHWLSNAMLHAPNKQTAIRNWRAISHRGGRNIGETDDFSVAQKAALTIPDDHIESLFEQTKEYLLFTASHLEERIAERIQGDHGHSWNDRYEIRQKPKRSLEMLREGGIRISIRPEDIEEIRAEYTEDSACPVLDRVKNKRIVNINGFDESKVSVSIHDIFDHFWTYDQLDRLGILDHYRPFLQSVGNPQDTDMFNREGELVASVSFEWRSSHTPERQFKQLFSFDQIRRTLEGKIKDVSDNQRQALAILSSIDPVGEEAMRLSSIYSGIVVELMEQRRKHGFIRVLNDNYEPVGNLTLRDPEYTSLIVETNHMLCEPHMRTKEKLFQTEAIVEDYLIARAKGDRSDDLTITLQDIEAFDPTTSRISPQRQMWLRRNPFHTATRVDRCDVSDISTIIEEQPHSRSTDEYLDLVDSEDNIIGKELRSVVYKEGISNFRVVNGFIRNDQGQLWIPIRQSDKRIFPNAFDFSVGEHVESGEQYDDAFKRGVREELNIDNAQLDSRLVGKLTPDDGASCFMQVYEINSNEEPMYNTNDFSGSIWVFPDELRNLIQQGQPAKSDILTVLNYFYSAHKHFYEGLSKRI